MRNRHRIVIAGGAVLGATAASADVVWPALYVASGAFSWYVIAAGLFLEYPFAKIVTGVAWRAAWKPTIIMNLASTFVGAIFLSIAGIAWELFPGSLIMAKTNMGTFNPYTWVATFIMSVLINSAIEAFVLRKLFRVPKFGVAFYWLLPANAISVALTFYAIRSQLTGFPWWPHGA